MNRTPPFTAAFIPKWISTRGVEDAYTHLKIFKIIVTITGAQAIFMSSETYPAIRVDVWVEEIRFEPKTGVQVLKNGQA